MITARVQFLQNSITADLSRIPVKLHEDLQSIGILTPQDLIMLDNSRTLKVDLYPEDYHGEQLLELVDRKSDSLGAVNKLCYTIHCMDNRDRNKFFESLDNDKYYTLSEAQHDIDRLREQRRTKNKKVRLER
ncbi:MAG: hypothetical protein SOS24_06100 [Clostridia bacterium]|nr:hypothetical protein [Clostridia bacterium]